MAETAHIWDRFSIKAEVERRGESLTGLSVKNGLYESACRQALTGGSYKGAKVLAHFLGVSFDALFPSMYRRNRAREDRIASASAPASQKRRLRTDVARAS